MSSKEVEKQIIPELIYDATNGVTYKKGRFFGKGGFAMCYEITDVKTNTVYAGKIVSKKLLTKHNSKDKLTQEIAIHRSLNHKHIVGFHGFFEDSHNVYIVLELCRRRSMMELNKRRKALTEAEVRYYIYQLLLGVMYLHKHRIIHRDLKLGNIFLNDELQVKIGDFGLAAKIEFDGERKRTICGTPNYIAPEILTKKGHSFEVDIWSIGCILYTLLLGKPPFETSSLKETYSKIKKCEYKIPVNSNISPAAVKLIRATLQSDPKCRPKVADLLNDEFLYSGYIPSQLPVSCLTIAPRADKFEKGVTRKPLLELNSINKVAAEVISPTKSMASPKKNILIKGNSPVASNLKNRNSPSDWNCYISSLKEQLSSLLKKMPKKEPEVFGDEATDPAAQPIVWISKWVDYSDKYGFGYQLCDEGVGVMFNDSTKLVMLPNGINVQYTTREGKEYYYLMEQYPEMLDKKMKLLSYFRRYMSEHLVKTGPPVSRESDSLSRVPYLIKWFRTTCAVVMVLTNGTLQINFMDHSKIILCPLMSAVTFIDEHKKFRTFRFSTIEEIGCKKLLEAYLQYALDKINIIV